MLYNKNNNNIEDIDFPNMNYTQILDKFKELRITKIDFCNCRIKYH